MAISVQPPEAQGKLPPQNLEAETSVLGAILLAEQALDGVLIDTRLRAEDFYRPRHQKIFGAMRRLKEKSDPEAVDAVTVCDELARAGELEEAGGPAYIHSLPSMVPAAGNVRHYARIVKQHALLRKLLDAARTTENDVYTHAGDVQELIDRVEGRFYNVAHEERTGELRSIEEVLHDELDKLELVSRKGIALTGTPSGLQGPRRPHRRLPARQPDRAGGEAVDGQVARSSPTSPRTRRSSTTGRSRCSRSRCRRRSSRSASSRRRPSSTATTCARDASSRTAGRRS